jgi:hypothetical protein
MHKESFIINRNTLLHVSTLLGHLQGLLSSPSHYGCTLQLSENVLLTVYCVVFGGVNPPVHSTQSTAHSHSTIKCKPSLTVTKGSP